MVSEGILKIIFIFNIAIILFIFFKSYYDTIKSKNYRNTKKIFLLQTILLLELIFNISISCELGGRVIGSGLEDGILYVFVYIPAFLFIVINAVVLKGKMKKKKYDLNNNISFKKYIVVSLVIVFITWGSIYFYTHVKIKEDAIVYYKNKYDIKASITASETIFEDDSYMLNLGRKRKAGILFILNNNEKIFYDLWKKKYYDNRQSNEITNLINTYYEDSLTKLINKFKIENKNYEYLKMYGYDNVHPIKMYSYIISADDDYNYKYYNEEEFYFNDYYNIATNDSGCAVKNILSTEELLIALHDISILCEKNGNWQQIMDEFLSKFELAVDFALYDINSVNEKVLKTHKLDFSSTAFAIYRYIDGKYILKK